jgi:FRG domain
MTSNATDSQTHFDDYGALKAYLEGLPPPKVGYVRVFRGQCKNYGTIRPTGVRVPLRNEHVWLRYCQMLAIDILIQSGVPAEEALSRGELWWYWYYAIVQHYGPGTRLLDVTYSLDVALWFALHRASVRKWLKLGYVNSSRSSLFPNLVREDEWVSYQRWQESPGVLYVFDVTLWQAAGTPRHGELVDLAKGPEFFAKSARIQAQKGCLIAADPADQDGDLAQFLIHPSISVAWPMRGYDGEGWGTKRLFPGPKEDEWYTRLLFLPVVPEIAAPGPGWRMAHPVPLSLYLEHLEDVRFAVSFNPLQPPLLFPWLIMPALLANPPSEEAYERAAVFFKTVPILLETPIVAMQPDPGHESWNHARLAQHLPGVLGVLEWDSGNMAEMPVRLRDVLFEFSPLECVGWTDLLREGGQMVVARAIHLVTKGEKSWCLQVFFQRAPAERIETLFESPASVRFDEASQQLQLEDAGGWSEITINGIAAKSFLVALWLLGSLVPDPACPLPPYQAYRTAPAVLVRTPDIVADLPYYVMRDTKTNEPYFAILQNGA